MLFAIFIAHEGKFKDTPTSFTTPGLQKTGLEVIRNTFRLSHNSQLLFSLVWTDAEVGNCQDINKKNNPTTKKLIKNKLSILNIFLKKAFCNTQLQVNFCHAHKKHLHLLMQAQAEGSPLCRESFKLPNMIELKHP